METTTTAAQLLTLSGSEDTAMETLDRLLTFFSQIDRNTKVGTVLDEWLDVRIDLGRLLSDGPEGLSGKADTARN
jgi:hypothetical protein